MIDQGIVANPHSYCSWIWMGSYGCLCYPLMKTEYINRYSVKGEIESISYSSVESKATMLTNCSFKSNTGMPVYLLYKALNRFLPT